MRRMLLAAVAALVCIAALGWGAVVWIDAEVDRRVAAAEARRRPIEPRQRESIESYTARVEWAKQRLAARGNTDPSPFDIRLELLELIR